MYCTCCFCFSDITQKVLLFILVLGKGVIRSLNTPSTHLISWLGFFSHLFFLPPASFYPSLNLPRLNLDFPRPPFLSFLSPAKRPPPPPPRLPVRFLPKLPNLNALAKLNLLFFLPPPPKEEEEEEEDLVPPRRSFLLKRPSLPFRLP